MSPELDKQLCYKYPKIFRDRNAPMTETCMCWGFDCGNGWYPLIDKLCGLLQWDTDKNGHPQIVASQVKEKYGTLRFYVASSNERQDGMIAFAESMSAILCDECGSPGKLRGESWYMVRCDEHATEPL